MRASRLAMGAVVIAASVVIPTIPAHSEATFSALAAADGVSTTVSDASVTAAAGKLTSIAESTTEAFEVVGVLRLGRVHAKATAVGHGDGPADVTSELEVGDATVAGQTVGITDAGIVGPAAAVLQQ